MFIPQWLCWVFLAAGAFPPPGESGLLSGCGAQTSLAEDTGSRARGLSSRDPRFSCFSAGEILPDRGSSPCLLLWQVDSLLPSRQGSACVPVYHACVCVCAYVPVCLYLLLQLCVSVGLSVSMFIIYMCVCAHIPVCISYCSCVCLYVCPCPCLACICVLTYLCVYFLLQLCVCRGSTLVLLNREAR